MYWGYQRLLAWIFVKCICTRTPCPSQPRGWHLMLPIRFWAFAQALQRIDPYHCVNASIPGPTIARMALPNTYRFYVLTNAGMTAVCLARPSCQRFLSRPIMQDRSRCNNKPHLKPQDLDLSSVPPIAARYSQVYSQARKSKAVGGDIEYDIVDYHQWLHWRSLVIQWWVKVHTIRQWLKML